MEMDDVYSAAYCRKLRERYYSNNDLLAKYTSICMEKAKRGYPYVLFQNADKIKELLTISNSMEELGYALETAAHGVRVSWGADND